MNDSTSRADEGSSTSSEVNVKCPLPGKGPILGIDFGTKRIGIAISDPAQSMALPLENYTLRSEQVDAEWLRQLARGYGVCGLVVGLPVHMSGEEGGKAKEARAFGAWAAGATSLPVTWWDERFSSAVADMHLDQAGDQGRRRKSRRDKLAAQAILQSFLDADDRTATPTSFRDTDCDGTGD